ncbi:MAG: DEAD/DEAH box helicase [bacterium]
MKILKNKLTQELKRKFLSHIFERGRGYYRNRNVKKIKALDKGKNILYIQGEVEGSDYYFCSFEFDLKLYNFKNLTCDCPYGNDCKHLAALGLKFIDLFDEFMDKSGTDIKDTRDSKSGLIIYINSGKITSVKRIETEKFEIDKIQDHSKTVEGGFEKLGVEKLLKKTLEEMGIDTKNFPPYVFNSLMEEICKNKITPLKNEGETIIKKFESEKYKIIINFNYSYFEIKIYGKNNRYAEISPSKFLNGTFELTEEQKKLFELMRMYNKTDWIKKKNFDYGKLFLMIKKSGIPVFREGSYFNPKKLNIVDNHIKPKAQLILKKRENLAYENYIEHNFIFKLDDEYKIKRYSDNKKIFIGGEFMVFINNCDIFIYEISRNFAAIILRIIEKNEYCREPVVEIELSEEEIIDLNKIIEDGKKYFDLKTDLEQNYNILKFDKSEPCVIVDFDEKEVSLEIKPVIDYGFIFQNVAETVYCAKMKTAKNTFKRREYKHQKKYVMHIDDENIFYISLEENKEIELYKSFYDKECAGFSKTVKCKRKGEDAVFSFYEANWPHLEAIAKNNNYKIIFSRDKFNFSLGDFKADFEVDLNADNDWLWFDAKCYCGDDKISIDDLKRYVADKKSFLKTSAGKMLKITNFEELEKFVMMLESFYSRENGGFEGKLYHAAELEYVFTNSKYYNAKVEESFKSFIKEAQSGAPVEKVKVPQKFNKILRRYQKEGINWLYFLRKYRFAGILADDMGLGKTLQSLVLLDKEKIKGKPSVVICPKTLLYNWKSEAEKFTPKLKIMVIDGTPAERMEQIKNVQKYDLIITGYATMKKDNESYKEAGIKFNYCILDEAQFIKNHATKNAQIVKKIDADFRLALTGTPLENTVAEIWSIFDFLMPGFLGSNKAFVKKFEKPIMKENRADVLENLKRKIECFMLRRTKREVLKELPPKIEQISNCQLEPAQNLLYQEILASVKKNVFEAVKEKGFNKSRIHILAGLTKLRQVCNHPALLLKDKHYDKYESAKLNMFSELLEEIIGNNRKVLVFSQFTMMLDILAEELEKNKIKYNYLSGKTRKRQEMVEDFNKNQDKKVFLISLKAGGTGLNLTSADNVIIFDPWWNPSVENQAIDRTHRIGQKNSVNVYRLITSGTIEERIMKLKEKKKYLFDNLVGESKDLFCKLTWDDIKELFK